MKTPILLSIQVGLPGTHGADSISQKSWESGIFKYPVEGRVWLDTLNLQGDKQHDLKNHGGPFRAVLAYGAPRYPVWQKELGRDELPYGSFGENFTVSELTENNVCLGDIFAVGEARLRVSQSRYPCWKLARRVDQGDLAARVEARGWGGWYNQVLQPGYVEAGDAFLLVERPYSQYPIWRIHQLLTEREIDPEACAHLASLDILSPEWRRLLGEKAAFE